MSKPAPAMLPGLPAIYRIAIVAGGHESAEKLSKAFGGKRVYIPKTAGDHHPLVAAGGRAAADAIMKEFGPRHMEFPKLSIVAAHAAAVEALQAGGSANDAAAASGLSYRQARRIKDLLEQAGASRASSRDKRAGRARDPRQIDIEDLLKLG